MMACFPQFDSTKLPKNKVELHVHLDGAIRFTTIWELAQKKGYDLKVKTLEELIDLCSVKRPGTLAEYIKPIELYLPLFVGDANAIERIAYEFCENCSQQGLYYVELRYSPHLLASPNCSTGDENHLGPGQVVKAVNNGLERGTKDFKVYVKTILCCIRGHPEWSEEVLELCVKFRNEGVCGIDIAGDEKMGLCATSDIAVFQKAEALNIHRTAHAGEAGSAENVLIALRDLRVERIGHGYRVLEDPKIYKQCLKNQVHFETCPYSSYLTGSVPLNIAKHPIIKFAEDNANFSINRDDPTINNKTLDEDYTLLRTLGLSDVHFARVNMNAVRSSFLPAEQKEDLLRHLKSVYGFN